MPEPAAAPLCLRFRHRGLGRYAIAAFLALWLVGWAFGELFALAALVHGLAAWLGLDPAGPAAGVGGTSALLVGAFLLVWLTFWTLGGLVAIRELLRMLWAVDGLVLNGDELVQIRRLGPLSHRRRFDAGAIQQVSVRDRGSSGGALVARLESETVVLTDLGARVQWIEAVLQLREALGLTEEATAKAITEPSGPSMAVAPAQPPPGWEALSDPLGERLLVSDRRIRRRQALVMTGFTALVLAAAVALARSSLENPGLWALTLIAAALAGLCVWGALWLAFGRIEWRLGPRQLVQQRRFRGRARERWRARALELLETCDSDNDRWYDLRAIELSGDGPRQPPKALSLTKEIHDPSVPRALGLWLARQTRVPFHDRVPSEAERLAEREAELTRLRDQLAQSGRAGRWLLGALERAVGPRNPPAEAPRRPQPLVQQRSRPSTSGRSAPEARSADGSPPRSPGGG
ncbi:MAG: hypothetical protein WBM08_07955 [Prochlorococcaceae cyanobacterium]